MIEHVSKASGSGSGGGSGGDRVGKCCGRVAAPVTAPSLGYLGFTWFFTWKPAVLRQCRKSGTVLYVNAIEIVRISLW
jgi:hypothetical protein